MATELMQLASEHFLAHPRFAAEQHCSGSHGNTLQCLAGGIERGTCANQRMFGTCRGRFAPGRRRRCWWIVRRAGGDNAQVAEVALHIAPLLGGLADHPAAVVAHAAAFHLAEYHHLPEQPADETGGITDFGPAHRILADAMGREMLIGFTRVVPEELTFVEPRLRVEFEMQRFDLGHALKGVQVCAGAENRRGIGVGPALPDQPGIPRAGQITRPGKHAARLLQTQAFDDLPTQGAE